MMLKYTLSSILTFVFFSTSISNLYAQLDAKQFLESRLKNPLLQSEGTMTGEGTCWHAAYHMDRFVDSYKETKDIQFLDAAVTYYDALIEKLHTSPDGYKGWVGPYIYDSSYICDVHIGDAILLNPMLAFSETVLKNKNPDIKKKFQDKANQYVQLTKKHLIEKWDARNTWHEDGQYGAYSSWNQYMKPGQLSEWREYPVKNSNLSLPFNKQNSMAIACLRIYRITGENKYRERALKIFNFMKSRMCLFQDHYVWNYWEPFGVWDIKQNSSNELRHWVNVHPYRNYQSGEIHEIVEAYHSGLTFTKTDIERMINTNLKVMWNGDKENPSWNNSNYAVQMAALGDIPIQSPPGGAFKSLAGTLWTGLSDFNQTIQELSGESTKKPIRFDRKHSEYPVSTLHHPFNSTTYFTMTAAIPSTINNGEMCNAVCQIRVAGNLTIELYTEDGELVKDIFSPMVEDNKNSHAGLHIISWDTKGISPGQYLIRWSLLNEYREFPITIN